MISKVCIVSIYFLYEKINYTCNLIGSFLWSIGGRARGWQHHWQHFASISYETHSFYVAVNLYSNRSQKMSNCTRTSISGHAFSAAPCVPLFSSSRILIKHWTDSRQIGAHLLIYKHDMTFNSIEFILFHSRNILCKVAVLVNLSFGTSRLLISWITSNLVIHIHGSSSELSEYSPNE